MLGMPELIVLSVVAIFFVLPIWLSVYLRKKAPNIIGLGIFLSLIFCPMGHLYLENATGYIIALFVIAGISKAALGSFFIAFVASPLLMWYRFYKIDLPQEKLDAPPPPKASSKTTRSRIITADRTSDD